MFMSWIFLFFLSKTYRRILYLLNADYYMHIPYQSNFYFLKKKNLQNTVFHKIFNEFFFTRWVADFRGTV